MSSSPTSRQPSMMRHRSLLWVIPERYARCLGWIVAAAGVASIVVVAMWMRPKPVVRHEEPLAEALSTHLAMPVAVKDATLEEWGQYTFADVAVGDGGAVLRAKAGTYTPPRQDVPGRLNLQRGTLRLDLAAWLAGRTSPVMLALHGARRKTGLWRVSLADFAVTASLDAATPLSLRGATVKATVTDAGNLHATLSGISDGARLTLTFDASDDAQKMVLTGERLPWVSALLGPTLGEASQVLTSSSGELKLLSGPSAAGADHNWSLMLKATLPLSKLPATLGLGDLDGNLGVNLQALARLGETATCCVEFTAPEGAHGSVSSRALRNLHYLLTGNWEPTGDDGARHEFSGVNLSLFVVRGKYVYIVGTEAAKPAGLFTPDGKNLLRIPSVDIVPIRDFQGRLDELHRLWKRNHTS